MVKRLEEMTDEELWQLFPIKLAAHNPQWLENYKVEQATISRLVGVGNIQRISHIGSTAVPGLIAKPTVDILLEIKAAADPAGIRAAMESEGYIFSPQPSKPAPHMMFMKGYTPAGFAQKVFHLHVRYPGDWDELYFRDYLLTHPAVAKEYGELKILLKERYEHDRDGYTDAKTAFVESVVAKSREDFPGRYVPKNN